MRENTVGIRRSLGHTSILLLLCFAATLTIPCLGKSKNRDCSFYFLRLFLEEERFEFNFHNKQGDTLWGIDTRLGLNSGYYSYSTWFKDVLPEKTFEEHFSARRLAGLSNNVLELFGSGNFVPESSVDSMTAVRIKAHGNPSVIAGDVFSGRTKNRIRERMASRGIPSFDIIIARPVQGYFNDNRVTHDKDVQEARFSGFVVTLDRYYQFLAVNGEMYLQWPYFQLELRDKVPERLANWMNQLRAEGLEVHGGENGVRIIRKEGAPLHIPQSQKNPGSYVR